jgi:hypothetical protein
LLAIHRLSWRRGEKKILLNGMMTSLSAAAAAEAKGGGDFILFWSTAAATKGFSFLSLSHSSPSYPFFNAKMNQKGKRQE